MEKLFESLKEIVTSPNAWLFLLFLVVVLILVIKMSKNGLFNVKTKTIQIGAIGNSENERLILTKQNNLAYSYIMALEPIIDDDDELKHYITMCMLQKVYAEVIKWILANHMSTSNEYVELKQTEIVSVVTSLAVNPKIREKEFTDRIKSWTRELITKLVQVRELNTNR